MLFKVIQGHRCQYQSKACMRLPIKVNKMLSYRRETALQGALIFTKSGRLGDNILRTL